MNRVKKLRKVGLWVIISIIFCCGRIESTNATSIIYNDFSNLSNFTLNGSASSIGNPVFFNGQNVLRLTNNLWQGGSAFLTNPLTLNSEVSFSTFFSFQITDPQGASDVDGQGADGLVFVVQTVGNNVGGFGIGIGYSGIPKSVGVEFDTWNNGAIDRNSGNHVGIDLSGNINSATTANVSPRMNNGEVWYAWVDYNGATNTLETRLSETINRPTNPLLSYNVDLVSVLAVKDAYIGFTSGTGGAAGDHDILSWQFVNDYNPIDPTIPEPSTCLLFLFGLIGMAGVRQGKKKIQE